MRKMDEQKTITIRREEQTQKQDLCLRDEVLILSHSPCLITHKQGKPETAALTDRSRYEEKPLGGGSYSLGETPVRPGSQ